MKPMAEAKRRARKKVYDPEREKFLLQSVSRDSKHVLRLIIYLCRKRQYRDFKDTQHSTPSTTHFEDVQKDLSALTKNLAQLIDKVDVKFHRELKVKILGIFHS